MGAGSFDQADPGDPPKRSGLFYASQILRREVLRLPAADVCDEDPWLAQWIPWSNRCCEGAEQAQPVGGYAICPYDRPLHPPD